MNELEKAKLLAAAHKLILSEVARLRKEILEEATYPVLPEQDQIIIEGPPGKDGRDGLHGLKGDPGRDGISITETRVDNGNLIVSLSTGDEYDLGNITGEQGPPGEDGIQGPIGEQGIPGLKGDKGDKGDRGDKGEQGIPGVDGRDGKPGIDGLNGKDGKPGRDGKDGKDGEQGIPGVKGPRGDRGEQGKQGIPGPTGQAGPIGPTGPKGDKGEKGDKGDQGDTPDIIPFQEKLLKDLKDYKSQISKQVTKSLKLSGGSSSGGGEVRLLRLDDVDIRNLANNAFIKYNASTGKLVFTTVVPGGGVSDFSELSGSLAASQVPQSTINISKFVNNANYANTSQLNAYISVANADLKFATSSYAASNTYVNTQLSKYLQVANSNVSNWDTAYGWGNHASAGYLSGTISSLTNGTDTLSLNGSNKVDLPGGTAYIFSATNNITLSADNSGDNILEIINNIGATLYTDRSFEIRTDKGASDKIFTFTQGGGLAFPDATIQTTAWSSNALRPYITVANTNAKFATKAYAASNTYVQQYLQVANSTSFITSSALTPYLSVANSDAKFATKAYAASNTYVQQYLQVANSTSFITSLALTPYISVVNADAKFATKAYAASNTYVQRYLQVANSTSFITSLALTPYISVTNANARFATKAYASSNTYVNTQLSKYLQVANSSVSNWNTAYGWGNHANVGYLTSVSWAQVTDKPANILTLNDVNVVSNDMLVNDSITIGSTAVALGQNITTLTGLTGVTSNAATAFIAGTAAESGVALQMPREGALRNMTNGQNTMYFDISNGGTAHGSFRFRSSSSFTELLDISTDGLRAITAYKGKTSFNVALDTVVTVDNIKYRISNQGGVFPQIASASGSQVDVCYDVLGVVSGMGTTNAQNPGYILLANGTWLSIYSAHGMDNRGDRLTAHITDKAANKIYRVTFMVTNNSSNVTGYNIIVERIL